MERTKEKEFLSKNTGSFSRTLKGMHFQVQYTQQSPHRFTRGIPQPAKGKQVT